VADLLGVAWQLSVPRLAVLISEHHVSKTCPQAPPSAAMGLKTNAERPRNRRMRRAADPEFECRAIILIELEQQVIPEVRLRPQWLAPHQTGAGSVEPTTALPLFTSKALNRHVLSDVDNVRVEFQERPRANAPGGRRLVHAPASRGNHIVKVVRAACDRAKFPAKPTPQSSLQLGDMLLQELPLLHRGLMKGTLAHCGRTFLNSEQKATRA
jgi:hypothetical protein